MHQVSLSVLVLFYKCMEIAWSILYLACIYRVLEALQLNSILKMQDLHGIVELSSEETLKIMAIIY